MSGRRVLAAAGLCCCCCCCGGGGESAAPAAAGAATLPPPHLVPRLAWLEELAARERPLAAERREELRDLMQSAFLGPEMGGRLAQRAERSLRESPDGARILEEALGDASADVRAQAAYELGRTGRQSSQVPLVLALKYEREPFVLLHVAAALARLGNDCGLSRLADALELPDLGEEAAALARELLDARLVAYDATLPGLAAALADLRRCWRERGFVGPAPPVLEEDTRTRLARHLVRLQQFQLREVDDARFVLGHMGSLGVPLLAEAVRAEESYLRTHALEVLRALGPAGADAGPRVLPLLGDPLTRADAARTLGELRMAEALPSLLAMLEADAVELRAAAAAALGPLGDERAVEPLGRRLQDPAEALDVQVMAAFSLALFEERRPARRFLEELQREGRYHAPTLQELLERVDAAGNRPR